jgi:hypothetical protein
MVLMYTAHQRYQLTSKYALMHGVTCAYLCHSPPLLLQARAVDHANNTGAPTSAYNLQVDASLPIPTAGGGGGGAGGDGGGGGGIQANKVAIAVIAGGCHSTESWFQQCTSDCVPAVSQRVKLVAGH